VRNIIGWGNIAGFFLWGYCAISLAFGYEPSTVLIAAGFVMAANGSLFIGLDFLESLGRTPPRKHPNT
jgi:hypothetical protein